jgi:RNA polymerase sigma-70 factor (ECF subfamily)
VKALENRRYYTPAKSSLRTWLGAMMYREFVDIIRRRQRRPTAELIDIPVMGLQESVVQAQDMMALVKRLPAWKRLMLLRSEIEGQSLEQIEADTGIPSGTVRSQVSRARKALKEMVL